MNFKIEPKLTLTSVGFTNVPTPKTDAVVAPSLGIRTKIVSLHELSFGVQRKVEIPSGNPETVVELEVGFAISPDPGSTLQEPGNVEFVCSEAELTHVSITFPTPHWANKEKVHCIAKNKTTNFRYHNIHLKGF